MRKTPLKKISNKKLEEKKSQISKSDDLKKFYLELWDKQEETEGDFRFVRCFESGYKLDREQYRELSICYSHILPKSKYPEYAMEDWNLKIVRPVWHQQFEIYPEKAPKQYEYQQFLLNKLI
jgi:hypothetical protein